MKNSDEIEKTPSDSNSDIQKKNLREANACIGIGAAVGALGVTAAIAAGAVCPICVVAAPGLIGVGMFRRIFCSQSNRTEADSGNSQRNNLEESTTKE